MSAMVFPFMRSLLFWSLWVRLKPILQIYFSLIWLKPLSLDDDFDFNLKFRGSLSINPILTKGLK